VVWGVLAMGSFLQIAGTPRPFYAFIRPIEKFDEIRIAAGS
jgi:hypothetical protein